MTQKKDNRLPILDEKARCGRLGARGRTQVDALAHWMGQTFKYGPLKEDKDK